MLRLGLMMLVTCFCANTFAKYAPWHTTHSVEKFPCMTDKETEFLKRIIDMQKIEQKLDLLSDHRKQIKSSAGRSPASLAGGPLNNKKFICPPFRGVRNPYPQVIDFGRAAPSERIRISDDYMHIIDGLSKNERWPMSFENNKGYYVGQTPRGTLVNLIPIPPEKGYGIRFIVQYLLWKDKTPPSLTLCYREELHQKCNPYKSPEEKAAEAPLRVPASTAKSKP